MNDKTIKKLSIKVKTCSRSRYPYFRNRQGGALLLGLIITMVIFAALGGAMVYLFSASAMDSVFGNFSQRAYYAAESAMRYAVATYRKTGIPATGTINFNALDGETLTFPNNGQATLKITPSPSPTVDVVATVVSTTPNTDQITLAGDLTIDDASKFPAKSGFFKIGAGTVYYRYRTRIGDILSVITGPGLTPTTGPTVPPGTQITATKGQYSITSTGYFPSIAGIGFFRRTVEYGWILSGIPPGGPPEYTPLPDPDDLVANNPFGNSTDLGRFVTENVGGGKAITVDQTTGGKAEAVLGYSGDPNPFLVAWQFAGNYLSYDIQIKIATGVWTGSAFDKIEGGSSDSVAKNGYIAGLTFRSTGINPGWWKQYGVDFAQFNSAGSFQSTMNPKGIYPDLSSALSPYATNAKGWSVKQSKYVKCTSTSSPTTCTVTVGGILGAGWVEYNPPMILLWTRNSNQKSGFDYWLAYKLLEDEPTTGIVDAAGLLKDWSTITLRVVEGASLRFNSGTTGFLAGDIVTGATSGAMGMVFKKIQTTGGNDVIILNNVTKTFTTTGESISALNGTTADAVEYRPRDNYIWAMFGDTDPHGTADDITVVNGAINDTRRANARILDHGSIDATNINCYVHWPETNIADWGNYILENCPTPQTVKNDYFKLVAWDTNLNTITANGGDADMLIMGTGKEAGAILRTSLWTTGAYTAGAFPYEVGFHSLGDTATKTYFDDLAINFPGQGGAGGINYVPYVQQ